MDNKALCLACLPEGVEVFVEIGSLRENGNVYEGGAVDVIHEDGYLGDRFNKGDIFFLTIKYPEKEPDEETGSQSSHAAVLVDKNKDVSARSDNMGKGLDYGWFQTAIKVIEGKRRTEGGMTNYYRHTLYPRNNVRLLSIDHEGKMEMFEIAIVAHDDRFFLTAQATHVADASWEVSGNMWKLRSCYLESEDHKWPDLIRFLDKLCGDRRQRLPNELSEAVEEQPQTDDLEENELRVVWYNFAQGFGRAVDKNGEAIRIHRSHLNMTTTNGLPYALPGQKLLADVKRIEVSDDPKLVPRRKTEFKLEATNIVLAA